MDWKGLEIRLQDVRADKICQPEHPEARRDYSLIYIDRLEVVLLRRKWAVRNPAGTRLDSL